ncbi:MAG: DNRLRE domain-containing protein, partial [Phycisphaerae bacterium]|nr:DNRLRE domain-containing protein [Phycisphaerae bacterium]
MKIRDWMARHRRSSESQSPGPRAPVFESLEPRLLLSTFFVEADADAFISVAHPLTNYGTRQDLLIGFDNADLTGGGDGQTVRSLIHFDLTGDFPPDFNPDSITDAYVMLSVTGSNNIPPVPVTVNAHEAMAGWAETAANWNNAPLYGSVIGYGDWVGQEFVDIPIGPAVVEGWYYSPELNFGLVIEAPWAEVNGRYIGMGSREFAAAWPPTLHVTYDEFFDVFDATIDLVPEMSEGDVAPGGVVTGNGTINGAGYGVVDYQWNWLFPDETTGSSGLMTADMVAGVAGIPSYTAFPTDDLGQYEVFVAVNYPLAINSNTEYYTVAQIVPPPSQPLPEIDVELGSLDNLHTYAFGGTRVGQSKSMTFTVRNEGQADLHVTQASGLDLPFTVNPVNSSDQGDDWNIALGATQTFAVTFDPDEEGDFNGVLTLYNDDPDETTYQMSFSGTTSMAAYEVWAGNTDYTGQPEHWRYYYNIDQQDYVLLGASSTPFTAQAFTGQYDHYVIATRARVQIDTVEGSDGSYAGGTVAAGNTDDPENIGGQPDGYYGLVGYQATYYDGFPGFVVVDNPDGWTGITVHQGNIAPTYRFHISQQVGYEGHNEPYGYEFWFDLEDGGYGQIDSSRFQSPWGLWYDMEHEYDPYWDGWNYYNDSFSSIAEMEAEFGVGNYLLELQTGEGTITTEFFYGDGGTNTPLAWPTQQPAPVSPVVGAVGVSTTPTLQWDPLTDPNVNNIHVYVGDASEFDVLNQGVALDVTSVSGFALEAATNYEWGLTFQNRYYGRNEDGYSYYTSRGTQMDVVFRTEGGGAVQPDLAIDWIYHVPGIYQATDSMVVAGQTSNRNEGNAVAYDGEDPVPFYFEIRLSADRRWGNVDDVVLSRWAESPWLGFAERSGEDSFELPAGITPGPYYIGAMIDADKQIAETNETNNILWSDAPDVLVAMPIPEGEARRFTIHLAAMPIYPVVVRITKQPNGDPDLTTDVDMLVFTRSNWNQPQTVFILAAEDQDTQDGSAVWTVWASEMPALTVPVLEQDNDYNDYALGGGADVVGDGSGGTTGVIVPGGLPAGDAPDFYQYNDPYPPSWYPGLMYCVPTASADAVVWLQEHGFDSLPGREQEVSIVAGLADDMASGDRTGTAWENVMPGLMQYLGDYYGPSEIEVTGLGVFGDGLLPDETDLDAVVRWLDQPHTAVILVGSA